MAFLLGFVFLVLSFLSSIYSSCIQFIPLFSIYVVDVFGVVFSFDLFSNNFLSVLFLVVSSVYFFGFFYVGESKGFFFTLNTFVFFMCMLILSNDFFFMLVGWDGLGVISLLLVLWYNNRTSQHAAMKTYLVNRLGDGFILGGLVLIFFNNIYNFCSFSYISLFIILGLMTKSAIFPFFSWLPDAMQAPTPVSALVHSSTLVTAGLYILFRHSSIIVYENINFFLVLGVFTSLYGGFCAISESDPKKLIAFSTVSQMGNMMVFICLENINLFFSYLLAHSCFKALLFITMGLGMLNSFHNQDSRLIVMSNWNPLISIFFLVSIFTLMGLPIMIGFLMKECGSFSEISYFFNPLWLFFFHLNNQFTVFYSFRLISSIQNFRSSFSYSFYAYFLVYMPLFVGCFFLNDIFIFTSILFSHYQNMIYVILLLLSGYIGTFTNFNFSLLNFNIVTKSLNIVHNYSNICLNIFERNFLFLNFGNYFIKFPFYGGLTWLKLGFFILVILIFLLFV
uniref:NADH dehydrogenase subunit 5 n=1 Tax=Miroplana shenzhensis TaxID=2597322 RepID=UPI001FAE8DC6|nr:NADH dehydrogenase subunit 5 [Miroplana shenzhensis]UJT52299.1 NADH dehydrogenase subunit 5 [Miroplana shenzhensis]